MNASIPLPTLLSHALLAFTIEFDNEAEGQIIHRTNKHGASPGSRQGPWLVSLLMWANCMQFIDKKGVSVRELESRARTTTNLAGMERWGYIVVEPYPADPRPKPPRSAWVVRSTVAGRKAQEIWRPLFGVTEKRWQERFGKDEIDELREAPGGSRRPARFRTARLSSDSRVRAIQPGAGLQADSIGAPRRRRG